MIGMAELEEFGYTQELRRSLGFRDLVIYGLVFMVPIAPFGIFGSVYASSGGMVALAYAVGALAMVFTAISYAEMAKAFPMAGSVYTYAGRGLAQPIGFVAGWMILLDYILVPALLYIVSGVAMNSFLPAVPVWAWVVVFILLNTVINYFGIALTARVTRYMLVAELVVLAIFLAVGVWALASGRGHFSFDAWFNPGTFSVGVVFSAVSIAVLSFLGFDAISTLAEENREDARKIGRSMVAALALAAVLFVAQTWVASMLVTDPAALAAGKGDVDGAFYDAAGAAGGAWLSTLTAVATAVAWGFADALVAQAATSRVLYAMARDRQLPKFLRQVHPRHRVPTNATLVIAAVSVAVGVSMAVLANDAVEALSTMVNFGALTAFILLHVAVLGHYAVRRGSRTVKHLVVPVCGLLILGYVMWSANAAAQVVGLVWLAVGIVLAVVLRLAGRTPAMAGMSGTDARDDAATEG